MDIKRCPTCGNLNISVDVGTNKINCDRCGHNGKEVKTNTYEELIDELDQNLKSGKEL